MAAAAAAAMALALLAAAVAAQDAGDAKPDGATPSAAPKPPPRPPPPPPPPLRSGPGVSRHRGLGALARHVRRQRQRKAGKERLRNGKSKAEASAILYHDGVYSLVWLLALDLTESESEDDLRRKKKG